MYPRAVVLLAAIACAHQAAASPVRRTLNFNMFVLRPKPDAPDRLLVSTDGISRFGPVLEYLVQRIQGIMSHVKTPPENNTYDGVKLNAKHDNKQTLPIVDASENEIDGVQKSKTPIIVRPSRTKPGTYEVEIDVLMDDEQLDKKTN